MKNFFPTLIFCVVLALLSCQGQNKASTDATALDTAPRVETPQPTSDTTLVFGGSRTLSVSLWIDSLHPSATCRIVIDSGSKIHAVIKPGRKDANLRFNQVTRPDGQSDGPFTQTLLYPVAARGTYTLRIGPSPMAEGRYSGSIKVTVMLE